MGREEVFRAVTLANLEEQQRLIEKDLYRAKHNLDGKRIAELKYELEVVEEAIRMLGGY